MNETNYDGIPSMDDFKTELEHSFKKINPGDVVNGTVCGVSDKEVTVDLNSYSEGIIPLEELSNDPTFSIKADIKVGDKVSCIVLRENKEGVFVLSMKEADDMLSWDRLAKAKAEGIIEKVKVTEVVKAGAVAYIYGIRAFIPASQLALTYTEDTSAFVGKVLECRVTEVNRNDKKVILSAKSVLAEKAEADRHLKVSKVQKGTVVTGKVEKLMPFGAFVDIGDGITGLVHISQIAYKKIKSPAEVLKEGEEVTVKVIDVKDGKLSLSMIAVNERDESETVEEALDEPTEYSDGDAPSTGLGALLAKLKI